MRSISVRSTTVCGRESTRKRGTQLGPIEKNKNTREVRDRRERTASKLKRAAIPCAIQGILERRHGLRVVVPAATVQGDAARSVHITRKQTQVKDAIVAPRRSCFDQKHLLAPEGPPPWREHGLDAMVASYVLDKLEIVKAGTTRAIKMLRRSRLPLPSAKWPPRPTAAAD